MSLWPGRGRAHLPDEPLFIRFNHFKACACGENDATSPCRMLERDRMGGVDIDSRRTPSCAPCHAGKEHGGAGPSALRRRELRQIRSRSERTTLQNARAEAAFAGLRVLAGGVVAARLAVRGVRAVALLAAVQLADHVAQVVFVIAAVVVVVAADVAGLLGAFAFFLVRPDDRGLDDLAAAGIDRVSDVGVELGPAVGAAGGAVLIEAATALIAVAGPQVVLAATAGAAVRQLAAGHGDKRTFRAFDDLEVADDDAI